MEILSDDEIGEFIEWGDEDCPHAGYVNEDAVLHKRECYKCWQSLQLKEVKKDA